MKTITLQTAVVYVAGAYIGTWVFFFGYLALTANKIANLRRQVEALTEAVDRKKKKSGDVVNRGS